MRHPQEDTFQSKVTTVKAHIWYSLNQPQYFKIHLDKRPTKTRQVKA